MSRYNRDLGLKFGGNDTPFSAPEKPRRHKPDALEEALRFASGIAPAAGTLIGGGIGALGAGLATGGLGAPEGAALGAGLGGAAGTALGAATGYGADRMAEPDQQAEEERLAREEERKARANAALMELNALR